LNNKITGNLGEDLAEAYLIKKGYRILNRNFRTRFGEIDLIARKDEMITFFEVKTRLSSICGTGREAVDERKIAHIRKAALEYITKTNWTGNISIDVIEIHLTHISNIV